MNGFRISTVYRLFSAYHFRNIPVNSLDWSLFKSGLIFSDTDEEWEAELEGELNEFEIVGSKEGSPQNPDWENEIQDMLDAEETTK